MNALQPRPAGPLAHRSAVALLPMRQAGWVGAQTATAAGLSLAGVWTSHPELAMSVAMGVGASVANPRKVWAMPLVTTATVLGGLASTALDLSPVLGAGAVAGFAVAWLLPEPADGLDYVNAALGAAAGSAIGLWAASALMPDLVGTTVGAALAAAMTGLVGAQGLLPLAFRYDAVTVPGKGTITRELKPAYRQPAFQALELYSAAIKRGPDDPTKRGLAEVCTWVFRLEKTLQTLDGDLASIDVDKVAARIAEAEATPDSDTFTRERRQATAEHLRRLLLHRKAIDTERGRTVALVDYALAYLEEAHAGLALGQQLPGEASPERLPDVLQRLRAHAAEGDTRRKTARELQS